MQAIELSNLIDELEDKYRKRGIIFKKDKRGHYKSVKLD